MADKQQVQVISIRVTMIVVRVWNQSHWNIFPKLWPDLWLDHCTGYIKICLLLMPSLFKYFFKCSQICLSGNISQNNVLYRFKRHLLNTSRAKLCANCLQNHTFIYFCIKFNFHKNCIHISIWMDLRIIYTICSAHVSLMRPNVCLSANL